MSVSYLYLLQCSYQRLESALLELSQTLTTNDSLVLMDDAIFGLNSEMITKFDRVLVLGDELINLGQHVPYQRIGYDELAEFIHNSEKVFTWR